MSLTEYLYNLISAQGRGYAKRLAGMLGKPYSTFMRELNPYDGRAKLGADTLMRYVAVTGDVRPLQFLAAQAGYGLHPLDQAGAEPGRKTADGLQEAFPGMPLGSRQEGCCPAAAPAAARSKNIRMA